MSGFVAVVNKDGRSVEAEGLARLTAALGYRGPDRLTTWHDGSVGMGHALFATTREAWREEQPATLDGAVRLVADARVDGREALLAALGVSLLLDETPDTDLLLRAWARWGEDALDHLLGDFAFALWDGRRRELFCACDRFGMRALYYADLPDTLVVSNSLPCLRAHPGVTEALDEQAIADFLLTGEHGWIDRSRTPYADVRALPPGHALVLRGGRLQVRRWWSFPTEVDPLRARRERDVLERFRHVFTYAVADRLRTDRAVIALGGGLDSATVAATVQDLRAAGDGPAAFSAVVMVYDRLPVARERPYVEATARGLGLELDVLVADDHALLAGSVPTTGPVELYQPTLYLELLRRVARRARVHLTGAAGDNLLLGGSVLETLGTAGVGPTLRSVLALRTRYGALPRLGSGLLARLRGRTSGAPAFPYPAWIEPDLERRLGLRERWRAWWAGDADATTRVDRVRQTLTTPAWSEEDLLRPDRFVCAEQRDPFLDLRVVELVLAMPALPWLYRKHVLREVLHGRVPALVRERPKTVLGDVHQALLEQPGAERVDDLPWSSVLDGFVVRSRVPRLVGGGAGPAVSYVGLRPALLARWVAGRW